MNTTERIGARWMGSVFGVDPLLPLPERPRIPRELVVLPLGQDGLLFAGAEELQVIRGPSAREHLPALLRLLDGTRTLAELRAALPALPAERVHDAVALLMSRGLLEDGAPREPAPGLDDVAAFLGRVVDVTRVNRDRHEALARLAAARVVIAGPRGAADDFAETLRDSGVGVVARSGAATLPPDASLAIALGADRDGDALVDAAFAARIPALPITVSKAGVVIGPLVEAGRSACPRCRARAARALVADAAGRLAHDHLAYLLHLAALRVFHHLARTATSLEHRSLLGFAAEPDSGELRTEVRPLPRTPGCSDCGLAAARLAAGDPARVAWEFHTSIEMPPRERLGRRDYQMHFRAANVQLAKQPTEGYDGAPVVALPPPAPMNDRVRFDAVAVATLLHRTAGFAPDAAGQQHRIAPTGGGLGSPALYVAALAVDGLAPALYHYHPDMHALERVNELRPAALRDALRQRAELPACIVIGAARLGKVYQKYREFAYRVVHFDAGVAASYLHAIGPALGVPPRELPDFDDAALAELVRLPTAFADYTPTFALGFGPEVPVGEDAADAPVPAPGFAQMGADIVDGVMSQLVRESRVPRQPASGPPAYTAAVAPLADLDATLLRRRAVRDHADAPVPAAALRELAVRAIDAVTARIAAGAAAVRLAPWIAVHRGGGELAPGLYEAMPDGELVLRRAGLTTDEARGLNSQDNLAEAPVSLFMVVDLDDALVRRGARGYREACITAGVAVGRAWLAAVALGLGACAGGGVIPIGLRDLAGLDGLTACPLLSLHVGVPR